MASTMLREIGWPADVVERQLSHKDLGVAGIYNKAQHIVVRRKILQSWADLARRLASEATTRDP